MFVLLRSVRFGQFVGASPVPPRSSNAGIRHDVVTIEGRSHEKVGVMTVLW